VAALSALIAPPLAHAGHWLASLLYLVPVLVVVGALVWQSWRDRRRSRRSAAR
jgi:membrane protein DedA with SNARE-associated domain